MIREALATVLGIGLGLFFIAYPQAVVRIQTAGRRPQHRGEYGADGEFPRWMTLLVRGLGILSVGVGGYIGAQQFLL